MKVTCTQENLAKGLSLVSHVASKNITLPILNNVLVRAEQGVIKLLTTNLEIGIICQVRGKVEKEGAFTVQAKTLSDYVNLLPKENIEIEVVDQNMKIKGKKSKTVMKGLEASEFPLIPEVEAKQKFEIPAETLRRALSNVAFAVAYDETRPEISGVYFNFEGNNLVVVATDSYRLAEKKVALSKPASSRHSAIVPIRTIQELVRILGDYNDPVTIACNENQILFDLGETKLTSRVIEGQYPDYQQIIPKEYRTKITVDTQEFINTVKRASLFCKPGGNDIVLKFEKSAGQITVNTTNAQVGESEAVQEATIEGDENHIVFNYRFLLDGLQNLGSSNCVIEINSNLSPGLIKPEKDGDYVYIIMPIKQ
ncbi:MAG: DNA polymerase III subunit beta [Patescibacteria group bacterium]|jgi:DNA polymerase-3 subunit beta